VPKKTAEQNVGDTEDMFCVLSRINQTICFPFKVGQLLKDLRHTTFWGSIVSSTDFGFAYLSAIPLKNIQPDPLISYVLV
jgi:hypothetical protein